MIMTKKIKKICEENNFADIYGWSDISFLIWWIIDSRVDSLNGLCTSTPKKREDSKDQRPAEHVGHRQQGE